MEYVQVILFSSLLSSPLFSKLLMTLLQSTTTFSLVSLFLLRLLWLIKYTFILSILRLHHSSLLLLYLSLLSMLLKLLLLIHYPRLFIIILTFPAWLDSWELLFIPLKPLELCIILSNLWFNLRTSKGYFLSFVYWY